MVTLTQAVVWVIVGLGAGTLVGLVVKRDRKGFGIWTNLGIGLAGAFVGGLLFQLFGILPGLDQISISLRDVVAAVVGAFIVLLIVWLYQRNTASGS